MAAILGFNDGVHTCECCGKSDLKGTFGVILDSGDVVHYGSVCVTRHLNKDIKSIRAEVEENAVRDMRLARGEYTRSMEYIELRCAMNMAREAGLIGRAFKQAVQDKLTAADTKLYEISGKYRLTRAQTSAIEA